MKKIISVLVIAVMLATCLIAALPASAATQTLTLAWNSFGYEVRGENGNKMELTDISDDIKIDKSATTLSANRTGYTVPSNSYISTSQFLVTSTTKYTYEVMAKNNVENRYAGVPFAIDPDGYVYFVYGSYDNSNDTAGAPNTTSSYLVPAKGDFDNKVLNGKSETDAAFFKTLRLDGGFASLKFEYNGLDVKIMAKDSSGNYVQVGDAVTLPTGSKVAFGIFTRDAEGNGNRTMTVKNGKITALNDEAVKNLTPTEDNGADDLKIEIAKAEKEYTDTDYTADTMATLKKAIADAKAVAESATSTKAQVSAAAEALKTAISGLKLKSADTSKLKAAIEKAEALKEEEWTAITYKMLMNAVDAANDILDKTGATQTEIDAALANIEAKTAALVSSGVEAETEKKPVESDDNTTIGAISTSDATESETGAPSAEVPVKKGCGSAVAATAVVVSIVATLGTALVAKKKD